MKTNNTIWITEEPSTGGGEGGGLTPAQVNSLIDAKAGQGVVLGFSGTLENNILVFKPENVGKYSLNNNYDYEIDLVFPAVGVLSDDVPIKILNNSKEIYFRNVLSGSTNATYGDLRQLCRYDEEYGWRWIFNARYKTADGTSAFIIQSSPVSLQNTLDNPSEHTIPSTSAITNTLDNYIRNDDYATMTNAGVVKVDPSHGVTINDDGELSTAKANESHITAKTNQYRPICPSNLDLAVKVGVTTNKITLTDDEKSSAQAWLGLSEMILTQEEYDALETKDENTKYYIKES